MNDGNSQSIAPITTIPKGTPSNGNIGKISSSVQDVANTVKAPIDRNQPNASSSAETFPGQGSNLKDTIFGLPPCGIENLNDPILMTAFQNSFPILTIKPIKIFRPKNVNGPTQTEPLGEAYKFAIKTDGGTSYGISNEYGSSMIEESFTNMVQFDSIAQLYQFAKTNRNLREMAGTIPQSIRDKLNITKDELNNLSNNARAAASGNTFATKVIDVMHDFGSAALNGMFMGQKIDIPNIWKGSSSNITQQVTIVLHCFDVNVDHEYERKIILPLQILLRLAAPYSTKGDGNNGSDEIITYENPPYIEASVDGLFRTKIGGISDFNVAINFMDQALCKGGRPLIITVSLTITDLYNAIIWTDEEHPYAPNGLGITNFLKDHDTDPAVNQIDEKARFMFMPDGGALEDASSIAPWKAAPIGSGRANAFENGDSFNRPSNDPNWGSGALGGTNDINFKQDLNINTSNVSIPPDTYNTWRNNSYLNTDANGNLFTDGPTAYSMNLLSEKQYKQIAEQEVQYKSPSSFGTYEC